MLSGLLKSSHLLQRLALSQNVPTVSNSMNNLNKSFLCAFKELQTSKISLFHSSSLNLSDDNNNVVISPLSELVKQAEEVSVPKLDVAGGEELKKPPVVPPLYSRTYAIKQREKIEPYRNWFWYDDSTEREERQREIRQQMFRDVGMSFYLNIPQSAKKLERILRMLRDLPYEEAWRQSSVLSLKASTFIKEGLEHARLDAENKGLDVNKLVLTTAYTCKGDYTKGITPMGKGKMGRKVTRRTHLRIILAESSSFWPTAALIVSPKRLGGACERHLRSSTARYEV
uniref:50S ribosomal protein L22, chloroplastic n=1 Tax=Polytomella parva TaxID=51329 RepID=A0A7S0V2L0_9CHLO